MSIPREFVSQIAPAPHGGHVQYIGPFSDGEWNIITPPDLPATDNPEENKEEAEEQDPPEAPWVFSGGAYYSNGQLPIAVDTHAGDRSRIRFTLAWRNRLNTAIAFHATMERPDQANEEEDEKENDEKRKQAPNAVSYTHLTLPTMFEV